MASLVTVACSHSTQWEPENARAWVTAISRASSSHRNHLGMGLGGVSAAHHWVRMQNADTRAVKQMLPCIARSLDCVKMRGVSYKWVCQAVHTGDGRCSRCGPPGEVLLDISRCGRGGGGG